MATKPRKAMVINQGTASIMKDGAHSTNIRRYRGRFDPNGRTV